jgi:hypothetical protein
MPLRRVVRIARLAASAALLGLCFAAPLQAEDDEPAAPTIYKWVDENGIAHYTTDRDRIPAQIRERVERSAPRGADVAAQPHREDLMRDAHKKPAVTSIPAPLAAPAPVAAAPPPAPDPEPAVEAPRATPPPPEPEPVAADPEPTEIEPVALEPAPEPESEPTPVAVAPAPDDAPESFEEIPPVDDAPTPLDAVSAPPPAPPSELAPAKATELAEIDQQIGIVEGEIAQREETLAALISSSDEQRTTPLVDDPAFREISQRLPKLQAELQTLRERRNEIVPTATVQ